MDRRPLAERAGGAGVAGTAVHADAPGGRSSPASWPPTPGCRTPTTWCSSRSPTGPTAGCASSSSGACWAGRRAGSRTTSPAWPTAGWSTKEKCDVRPPRRVRRGHQAGSQGDRGRRPRPRRHRAPPLRRPPHARPARRHRRSRREGPRRHGRLGAGAVTIADEAVSADIVALLDGCTSTFQMLAEQEEGPYRRGEQPRRRDVTDGCGGSPFRLGLRLHTQGGDAAVGVDVEIWHCDRQRRYSGYPPNDPAIAVDPSPQLAEYRPDETSSAAGRPPTLRATSSSAPSIPAGIRDAPCTSTSWCTCPIAATAASCTSPRTSPRWCSAQDPYRDHGLPNTTHASETASSPPGETRQSSTSAPTPVVASGCCVWYSLATRRGERIDARRYLDGSQMACAAVDPAAERWPNPGTNRPTVGS